MLLVLNYVLDRKKERLILTCYLGIEDKFYHFLV